LGFSEGDLRKGQQETLLSWLYGQGRLTPEVLKKAEDLREEVYPSRSYSEDCLRVEAILAETSEVNLRRECEYLP